MRQLTQIIQNVKTYLNHQIKFTQMCFEDMKLIKRMAVETIVTTHVHQREVFDEINDDCKHLRIDDGHDLSWTENN